MIQWSATAEYTLFFSWAMVKKRNGGQVQVAPELMKWLRQSRKDAQLQTHLEEKGKSDPA